MSDKVVDKKLDNDPDEQLGEAGMRALRAEREENRQLREDLRKLKDEIQAQKDAELSDLDKWKKKAEAADAKVKAFEKQQETDAIRQKVAERAEFKDVPADLITGGTEEEMVATATKIASLLGPRTPEQNPFLEGGNADGEDTDQSALGILGFGG